MGQRHDHNGFIDRQPSRRRRGGTTRLWSSARILYSHSVAERLRIPPLQSRVEPALLLRIERTLDPPPWRMGSGDHCAPRTCMVRARVSREGCRCGMHRILRLWFGLSEPLSRGTYLFHGALLMGIKYSADNALVHAVTGRRWTPWDYVSPLFSAKSGPLEPGPAWLWVTLAL